LLALVGLVGTVIGAVAEPVVDYALDWKKRLEQFGSDGHKERVAIYRELSRWDSEAVRAEKRLRSIFRSAKDEEDMRTLIGSNEVQQEFLAVVRSAETLSEAANDSRFWIGVEVQEDINRYVAARLTRLMVYSYLAGQGREDEVPDLEQSMDSLRLEIQKKLAGRP
jgi:hypothetical protein